MKSAKKLPKIIEIFLGVLLIVGIPLFLLTGTLQDILPYLSQDQMDKKN